MMKQSMEQTTQKYIEFIYTCTCICKMDWHNDKWKITSDCVWKKASPNYGVIISQQLLMSIKQIWVLHYDMLKIDHVIKQ